ncbi:cytidylyltransferase domain-containing protein [uncultured Desulfobacter sp.]|uniref:cytidylyltransferase domain-containing protein n=1 Tax=uncultured Desulfobacter sp. TaxID=240139 RepID=UPI0029F5162F|nr:hypothetical protein [uncultured Desulfobacter sp.]
MTKVHALIVARGGGSSFYRKNTYSILGKPVIAYAIETCRQAKFINDIFVWSEDSEIQEIASSLGAHPLQRPRSMVHYHSGFASQNEWTEQRNREIIQLAGGVGDVNVSFNCNNFLFKSETLQAMYEKGKKDESLGGVIAVSKVNPGFCTVTKDGSLFPFWNDPNIPLSEHPPLYRRIGVAVTFRMRMHRGRTYLAPHVVSPSEAFDLQSEEEVPFAEFHLRNRYNTPKHTETL